MGRLGVTIALIAAAVALAGGQTKFKTGVDLVSLGVTAVDRKGDFVTSLGREDFEIYEDGVRQTIKYFLNGSADRENAPELHLGVLFDISGSMDEDMKLARSAAIKFLNTLDEAVDITLVDFTTEVRVTRYAQADFPRLVERIRGQKAEGYTALYDAVGVYLDGASGQEGRKVMILYTDGGDNSSATTYSDALTSLRASDVTAYTVGFLEHQSSSARLDQRARLQQIAETTGGQAFFPSSLKSLDGVYEKIQAEIKAQYLFGYLSTNQKADGSWRKVEIRLARPDLKDVKLRTRRGYFAPFKKG